MADVDIEEGAWSIGRCHDGCLHERVLVVAVACATAQKIMELHVLVTIVRGD